MVRTFAGGFFAVAIVGLALGPAAGCRFNRAETSPAAGGFNTRDLIDPDAQAEADDLTPTGQLAATAERLRKDRQQKLEDQSKKEGGVAATQPNRNILCLSGGGSFGAYSAGVLVGWSERGDRPAFDVVTGISTGALIAPFAFLGPKYDAQAEAVLHRPGEQGPVQAAAALGAVRRGVRGHRPAGRADRRVPHRRGDGATWPTPTARAAGCTSARPRRRGSSSSSGTSGRWPPGTAPGDRELIVKVLLGSAAPAGFFPAAKIDVTVDGVRHTERHVDGGVSQALFFRPPYVPAGGAVGRGRAGPGRGRRCT